MLKLSKITTKPQDDVAAIASILYLVIKVFIQEVFTKGIWKVQDCSNDHTGKKRMKKTGIFIMWKFIFNIQSRAIFQWRNRCSVSGGIKCYIFNIPHEYLTTSIDRKHAHNNNECWKKVHQNQTFYIEHNWSRPIINSVLKRIMISDLLYTLS